MEQIREFFSKPSEYGIDQIDAIAFVAQASLARLTDTQRYIFQSVLSLFGKNIEENIFLFLTFADIQDPPILQSVGEAGVPYKCYFKFNNSVLYIPKQNKKNRNEEYNQNNSDSDDDDVKEIIKEMFWKMGEKSWMKFYKELQNATSKSITMTADVLEVRKVLETSIAGILRLTRSRVFNLEMLKKEEEAVRKHKKEIDSTKDFTYTVIVEKVRKRNLEDDHAMVCHKCQFTCHYPCSSFGPKFMCPAMKFIAVVRGCDTCPQKCSLSYHENVKFAYDGEVIEETRTLNDLKKRYEDAQRDLPETKELVEKIRTEIGEFEADIKKGLSSVRDSLKRLKEIALKPNHLTLSEYINFLVQNEEAEGQAGWQERRAALLNLHQQTLLIGSIAQDNTNDADYTGLGTFSNTTAGFGYF